ncbi:MAG: hypothetical protein WC523_00105 [Patescibacteria group bacterium]
MKQSSIYNEIREERKNQDNKWGGANNDDYHTEETWVVFLVKHLGKAMIFANKWDLIIFRKQMIRVAALAVAAIEWCDRKNIK